MLFLVIFFANAVVGSITIYCDVVFYNDTSEPFEYFLSNESFEGSFPPFGWSTDDSTTWCKSNVNPYVGTYSMRCNGSAAAGASYIRTPYCNLYDDEHCFFSFKVYNSGADTGEFIMQLYDGTDWDTVLDLGNYYPSAGWNYYRYDMYPRFTNEQYFHDNFALRFYESSLDAGEYVYVDDFTLLTNDENVWNVTFVCEGVTFSYLEIGSNYIVFDSLNLTVLTTSLNMNINISQINSTSTLSELSFTVLRFNTTDTATFTFTGNITDGLYDVEINDVETYSEQSDGFSFTGDGDINIICTRQNTSATLYLYPDGYGITTYYNPYGATHNWDCVNETVSNNDTDYVYWTNTGDARLDEYSIQNTSVTGLINFVFISDSVVA